MAISPYCLIPPLPKGLKGLADLALDLRWSWSHATDRLWARIDPEVWNLTRNPWLILQTVSAARLADLARDPRFRAQVREHLEAHRKSLKETTWFAGAFPDSRLTVAYFCMEFGLSEALPIYSGGLGILAGDHLKTANDLGVPVVGIGLLYQQGYFRQVLDADGGQVEFNPYNDPSQLPILPVRDAEGEWLRIGLDLPGRQVQLRVWEANIGRVKLYLLDSNEPTNSPADQCITAELYGGGPELRLQQEMVLGIGGWRLLRVLGVDVDVCHLNEGHAALAVIERARSFMEDNNQPFGVSLAATRPGNVFTSHTPVEAGFDRFSPELVARYLGGYAERLGIGLDGLLALGRANPADAAEPLNMAYLAARGVGAMNGVSRLHGEVSRGIFQPLFPRWPRAEVPVTHVTNGVHVPSWDSAAADRLWHDACGKDRWRGTMDTVEADFRTVTDEALWAFRNEGCRQLVDYARARLARQREAGGVSREAIAAAADAFDPNALTIGFARRFASYKRPTLLLHDPDRLARLLADTKRPLQLIIAGKAHPMDQVGKAMIRAWSAFIRRPDVCARAMFLSDYDMSLAERLVQGVDLWINTPRRPWEASGTSGMKVMVNGGLNLSELDGWWAEAYRPEVGWALGDGQEHDHDPDWDAHEADELYRLLEEEVIPTFYKRDENGTPRDWVARMRQSMAGLVPRFSTNRMVREYVEKLYLPAAKSCRTRIADGARKARALCAWREELRKGWSRLGFGNLTFGEEEGKHVCAVTVYLNGLDPSAVAVQLYTESADGGVPEVLPMRAEGDPSGREGACVYRVSFDAQRPYGAYTPRIVPAFDGAAVPVETAEILWYR